RRIFKGSPQGRARARAKSQFAYGNAARHRGQRASSRMLQESLRRAGIASKKAPVQTSQGLRVETQAPASAHFRRSVFLKSLFDLFLRLLKTISERVPPR